jgi:hypothetical protein
MQELIIVDCKGSPARINTGEDSRFSSEYLKNLNQPLSKVTEADRSASIEMIRYGL